MARFAGTPVENAKPRFGGVPVEAAPTAAAAPSALPDALAAASAASSKLSGGPGVQPPEQGNWYDGILGAAGYAGETGAIMADSARRGVANVAGLPVDLINASPLLLRLFGVDAQPFSPNPIGGSKYLNDISKGFGLIPDAPKPEDPLQTILSRVAEEVGATMVPAGGFLGAAARTSLPAVREAGGMSRYLLEPALVDPAKYVGKEVAAATAAGTGAGVANTLVDRNTTAGQAADLGGAVAGVGLAGVGNMVRKSLGDLLAAAGGNPKYASEMARNNAADTIIGNSDVLGAQVNPAKPYEPVDTQALVDLLQRQAPAENLIPGFKATTADRAGDFGLASLEDARARGPNAGRFRAAQEANTGAIDNRLNDLRPTEQPGTFTNALEGQRGAQLSAAEATFQDAIDAARRATEPLTATSTPTARGNTVRNDLLNSRDESRAATDAAYQAAEVRGTQVDPTDLSGVIDNATSGMTVAERSVLPNDLLDQVRNLGRGSVDAAGNEVAPDPIDIAEATTLLTRIKRAQRLAMGPTAENGGRDANRVLGQVGDALEEFISRNITPEQNGLLDAARRAKFNEAERFGRGGDPVAEALRQRDGGRFSMADERVAGSFVTPPQNLDRLFTEANTPATRAAIRDEMLSRLDSSSSDGISRFMSTFQEQIARFPGLADELRTAASARTQESLSGTARTEIQRLLGTPDGAVPGRGTVAKYLQFEPSQADRAMENVLAAKSPGGSIDELLSFVGDEASAVEGARAAFWRVMEKRSRSNNAAFETAAGVDPWMPKKWRTFLDDPATSAVAERLYRDNPEHLQNIRDIAESLRGVNTGKKAGAAINPSGSAQSLRNGAVTLAEAQAKMIDVQRGRLNPLYAVTYLAGKIANRLVSKAAERAYQRLLDEALINPDVAAELLKTNNPANRAALARKAKGWLGNQASGLVDLIDGGEGEDPKQPIDITVGGKKEPNDG